MSITIGPNHVRVFLDSTEASKSFASFSEKIKIVSVDHGRYDEGDKNLLQIAQTQRLVRDLVYEAAISGYVAYASPEAETRFVRLDHIPRFWTPCLDNSYRVSDEGLIYTVEREGQRWPTSASALLVVFSSMSAPWNKASLSRYFEHNFASISKHVPDSVAILRIADLDGVVGGFYLPTVNYPTRDADVANLIRRIGDSLGIDCENVVLYGASKGGTAALNLGCRFGFSYVAVDPVVNDRYYETRYGDSHWTAGGVFLDRKDIALSASVERSEKWSGKFWSVISGYGSPLFPSIAELIIPLAQQEKVLFLKSTDSRIKDHPDVSFRTLRTVTGLINAALQGLELKPGTRDIYG